MQRNHLSAQATAHIIETVNPAAHAFYKALRAQRPFRVIAKASNVVPIAAFRKSGFVVLE